MLSTGYKEGTLTEGEPNAIRCLTPKINPIFPWDKSDIDLTKRCPTFNCWLEQEEKLEMEPMGEKKLCKMIKNGDIVKG